MIEKPEDHFVGQVAQKVLIEKEGKILFVKNLNDDRWDLPGGRLHLGESPKEGVARELQEELGCQCEIGELVHVGQYFHSGANIHCLFINYRARLAEGASISIAEDELSEYHWMTVAEFEGQNTFDNCTDSIAAYKKINQV